MPNWCRNTIIVRGSKAQREEFKSKYCEKPESAYFDEKILSLDFNKIIPEPKNAEECPAEYLIRNEEDARKEHLEWNENDDRRFLNWYKFHIDKWGCKWDCDPIAFSETKTSIRFEFLTPWGPPSGIINYLFDNHPNLKMSGRFYVEELGEGADYNYKNYQKLFKEGN